MHRNHYWGCSLLGECSYVEGCSLLGECSYVEGCSLLGECSYVEGCSLLGECTLLATGDHYCGSVHYWGQVIITGRVLICRGVIITEGVFIIGDRWSLLRECSLLGTGDHYWGSVYYWGTGDHYWLSAHYCREVIITQGVLIIGEGWWLIGECSLLGRGDHTGAVLILYVEGWYYWLGVLCQPNLGIPAGDIWYIYSNPSILIDWKGINSNMLKVHNMFYVLIETVKENEYMQVFAEYYSRNGHPTVGFGQIRAPPPFKTLPTLSNDFWTVPDRSP